MRLLFVLLLIFIQNLVVANIPPGLFDVRYDAKSGKVSLFIDQLNTEFLYINFLAHGVGSNDLGLDRGKLMNTRIVKFIRHGNKILLFQPNQKFRANSDNLHEVKSVEDAFAASVLWGFDIVSMQAGKIEIDLTPFLLSDANHIAAHLKKKKQGTFKVDPTRSAVKSDGVLVFPDNIEFETLLTFVGEARNGFLSGVTPSADALTVVQHLSFVRLPDKGYAPRKFDPMSGYFYISYYDYATPIDAPLQKKYILRHRLIKKKPDAAVSEPVEPIVYYLDSGCPEPVRSALMEGASWWNTAFEAAGFKNAFIIRPLPEGAHPLDVRYNVIQWVHRSTRGWSYGASVVDPRTGEIIKGHVSLGSLRVRQDYMIAQGLLSPFATHSRDTSVMEEMALARLRQLAAHEVGHTLGLAHNFAASTRQRASVMDYPHPLIRLVNGKIDLSDAYDKGIGEWDKRAIIYGYAQPNPQVSEGEWTDKILRETIAADFVFMTDADARPHGSAHPKAHLWDNGDDLIAELEKLMKIRKISLSRFGENTIPAGTPYSELEKVFVPIYLLHRYQAEAVSKLIGGVDYNYAVKDRQKPLNMPVSLPQQKRALSALLKTLSPAELHIPDHLMKLLLPPAHGFPRTRESFGSRKEMVFDPYYAAEAYAHHTMKFLFHPARLSRLDLQGWKVEAYLNDIYTSIRANKTSPDPGLKSMLENVYWYQVMKAAHHPRLEPWLAEKIHNYLETELNDLTSVYWKSLWDHIKEHGDLSSLPSLPEMPPGSPIGCGAYH